MKRKHPIAKRVDEQAGAHAELLKAHLALADTVGELGRGLGEVVGQLKILPDLVTAIQAQVLAMQSDAADRQKNWRERVTKALGFLLSGGVVEAMHRIGWL